MLIGVILVIAGILIAVYPVLLSLIVAFVLIFLGIIAFFVGYNFKKMEKRFDNPFIDFFVRF